MTEELRKMIEELNITPEQKEKLEKLIQQATNEAFAEGRELGLCGG